MRDRHGGGAAPVVGSRGNDRQSWLWAAIGELSNVARKMCGAAMEAADGTGASESLTLLTCYRFSVVRMVSSVARMGNDG